MSRLPSTRRGSGTLEYAGASVHIVPSNSRIAKLEKRLKMNWVNILALVQSNPFLIVDIIFDLQDSDYTLNELQEWLMGDLSAFNSPVFLLHKDGEKKGEKVLDEDGEPTLIKEAGALFHKLEELLSYAAGTPLQKEFDKVTPEEKKA